MTGRTMPKRRRAPHIVDLCIQLGDARQLVKLCTVAAKLAAETIEVCVRWNGGSRPVLLMRALGLDRSCLALAQEADTVTVEGEVMDEGYTAVAWGISGPDCIARFIPDAEKALLAMPERRVGPEEGLPKRDPVVQLCVSRGGPGEDQVCDIIVRDSGKQYDHFDLRVSTVRTEAADIPDIDLTVHGVLETWTVAPEALAYRWLEQVNMPRGVEWASVDWRLLSRAVNMYSRITGKHSTVAHITVAPDALRLKWIGGSTETQATEIPTLEGVSAAAEGEDSGVDSGADEEYIITSRIPVQRFNPVVDAMTDKTGHCFKLLAGSDGRLFISLLSNMTRNTRLIVVLAGVVSPDS